MTTSRRGLLALGLVLAAPCARADTARDSAPPASEPEAWVAYSTRLSARLDDAGGARFDRAAEDAAFQATNRARTAGGAIALAWDEDLAKVARAHAADLAHRGYFEHLSPEGFDPSHRFWLLSRSTIGSPSENIAFHRGRDDRGAAGGGEAMALRWRSSPGHWRNLMRADHTHGGCGLVRQGDRAWLVGLYARPLAQLAEPLALRPDPEALSRALQGAPGARIGRPQGARPTPAGRSEQVLQISAVRRGARGAELVGGPVFVAALRRD